MSLRTLVTVSLVLAMGWLSLLAAASAVEGYPAAECALSADKSALVVVASNSGATSYACTATCRYTEAGQRALQNFQCNFSLGASAAEKAVCEQNGSGAGHFAEVKPIHFACVPR